MSRHHMPLILSCLCTLLFTGCQSLSSYGAICQNDEECERYQRCDAELQACVLRDAYEAQVCDPEATFDRCPTATSCDANARRCLPRKMRIAWIYTFSSSTYGRRQTANLIEYLTRYVAETYFDALTCDDAEELPHVVKRCASDTVEYLFLDTSDDTDTYKQRIRETHRAAPFDLALTYFSSGYSLTNELRNEHDIDFFTIGRVNRRADRVEQELEPGFEYPTLEERGDVSITALGEDYALPDYMFDKLFCDNPLIIYEDNQPYKLDRLIYERVWANRGECLNYMVIPPEPKASYPEVVARIREQDHDCIYLHQASSWLPTILKDYADVSTAEEKEDISWIFVKSRVDSGSENALEARRLIETHYPDSTYVLSHRSDRTNYEPFVQRLEPQYRDFLEEQGCLGLPQVTCEQLDCALGADASSQSACEALQCALAGETPSCLELGCYVSDPPEVCQLIECPLISSTCDYYEPNFLRDGESTITAIVDMVIASQLLSLKHAQTPAEVRPVSREQFRDLFFDLTAEQNACGLPDLSSCTRQIQQQFDVELQYVGLRGPWNFTPDGRIADSQIITVIEKFNGQNFSPSIAYTPAQKEAIAKRDDTPMATCPEMP